MKIFTRPFWCLMACAFALGLVRCASIPKDAPAEFSQARDEIALADGEDVDEYFPKTMTLANDKLSQANELFNKSRDYRDPDAQGNKRKEAAGLAAESRNLASTGREAYRRVHAWDSDAAQMQLALQAPQKPAKSAQAPAGSQVVAFFDSGKTELNNDNRRRVLDIAETLRANETLAANVLGYADPTGSPERNEQLAGERAHTVANELIAAGVKEERIKIRAIPARQSQAGREPAKLQLERRVEIRLVPVQAD